MQITSLHCYSNLNQFAGDNQEKAEGALKALFEAIRIEPLARIVLSYLSQYSPLRMAEKLLS